MSLLDHFHPPLKDRRQWQSLHTLWAASIAADLNKRLPEGYAAEINAHFGIEVDVAALSDAEKVRESTAAGYAVPPPTQTIPISIITDEVEILVYNFREGPILEAAIELVSPANKDRPANRDAFVSKCASLIQQGIGLMIVDIVTERRANLHNELLVRLRPPEWIPLESHLYATAYHLVERDSRPALEMWQEGLSVGCNLPVMPLFLRDHTHIAVSLDETYVRTCIENRIASEADLQMAGAA